MTVAVLLCSFVYYYHRPYLTAVSIYVRGGYLTHLWITYWGKYEGKTNTCALQS